MCIIYRVALCLFRYLSHWLGEGSGNPLQYSCLENPMDRGAWWAAVHGIAKSQTQLSDFTFTFHFHALEKEMATHSSVLAWRIPGTGEPGGLLSTGSHRVGHDWSNLAAAAAAATWLTKNIWNFSVYFGSLCLSSDTKVLFGQGKWQESLHWKTLNFWLNWPVWRWKPDDNKSKCISLSFSDIVSFWQYCIMCILWMFYIYVHTHTYMYVNHHGK